MKGPWMRPGSPGDSAIATAQTGVSGAFLRDVVYGLGRVPKSISSRWFYDDEGSRLFDEITRLPEYYLTACEAGILASGWPHIQSAMEGRRFHLVDLGAGEGTKTRILLSRFAESQSLLGYVPVDVSAGPLARLARACSRTFPDLPVRPLQADYLSALSGYRPEGPKLVLFLGSSVGNFDRQEAVAFLDALRRSLSAGDVLLIGFDLRKDPGRILRAYSDSAGVTARFNYNLLERINRELGGDFRIDGFRHEAIYDAVEGVARSYLVARRKQTATIGAASFEIRFREGEAIHTENSQKYTLEEISSMASASGFEVAGNLIDSRHFFADSLWLPKPVT